MRKLATIQEIKSLSSIPDADKIEVAQIKGWKVVVKKGEFKVGDLCVYCEIDSLLPERPEFEFLRKDKFRIRTIRLRGQISQGICFPLDILPKYVQISIKSRHEPTLKELNNPIGFDVTETLDIKKYEPPIPAELSGDVEGGFPSFLIKTDEERIQNLPEIPKQYFGHEFIATEKLDGSSCTIYWKNGKFGICGRNWEYKESPTQSMWKYARQNNLEEKLSSFGKNIAIQGEIIGEGIQGNKYRFRGQTIRVFRIFSIDDYKYLPYDEMVDIVENILKILTVPILDWNYKLPATIEEILQYAEGKSSINPTIEREGVVFVKNDQSNLGRLSFKAISNKFLIKNNE